ncbi:SO2930 family diheme c-type cytochrome [Shewanella maritima]|uniref:SO2930 family diheme c-type cytochrome n=1 Tax=Shewanella maritima TaxID=2520507 RepID=UPI00373690DE
MKSMLFTAAILFVVVGCGGASDSTPVQENQSDTPVSPPTTPTSVCDNNQVQVNWTALMQQDCPNLSDYGLFIDPTKPTESPQTPGISYQLSTELFSNYASKYRFVFLPDNSQITFNPTEVFALPVGTVLVKTFALPNDTQLNGPDNERNIETRLLIHRETGWEALVYQWDEQEQTASLNITGSAINHTLISQGQSLNFDYQIPSKVECKVCHQSVTATTNRIIPIGLKAHLLNTPILTQTSSINQLTHWQQQGWLAGLPAIAQVAQSFAIDDETQTLTARAKGYLDVNCAHCHSEEGFASLSGLRLGFDVDHTTFEYGICKQPPGWDGGPDGLAYDIVPGNGERSIVHNRQILSSAKDRMPPIGREIIHYEGVELVKRWIDSLPPSLGLCQ